jgi:hypothetical protein
MASLISLSDEVLSPGKFALLKQKDRSRIVVWYGSSSVDSALSRGEQGAQSQGKLELDPTGADRGLAEALLRRPETVCHRLLVDTKAGSGRGGVVFAGEIGAEGVSKTLRGRRVVLETAELVGNEGPRIGLVLSGKGIESHLLVADELRVGAVAEAPGADRLAVGAAEALAPGGLDADRKRALLRAKGGDQMLLTRLERAMAADPSPTGSPIGDRRNAEEGTSEGSREGGNGRPRLGAPRDQTEVVTREIVVVKIGRGGVIVENAPHSSKSPLLPGAAGEARGGTGERGCNVIAEQIGAAEEELRAAQEKQAPRGIIEPGVALDKLKPGFPDAQAAEAEGTAENIGFGDLDDGGLSGALELGTAIGGGPTTKGTELDAKRLADDTLQSGISLQESAGRTARCLPESKEHVGDELVEHRLQGLGEPDQVLGRNRIRTGGIKSRRAWPARGCWEAVERMIRND